MARPRHSLLIVDDEAEILETLGRLFRARYRVLTAASGPEALEILDREEVHLILTDQRMPGMPGNVLLAEALRRQPDAVRMMSTGYADIQAVVDAINRGQIFRYIVKPWDTTDLEGVLRQAAEQYDLLADRRRLTGELEAANARLREEVAERRRAEEEVRVLNGKLERRIQRLDALRRIDAAINTSHDLRLTLAIVLDQALAQLRVDAATILLCDAGGRALDCAVGRGLHTDAITSATIRFGECHAGRAVVERRLVAIADLPMTKGLSPRDAMLIAEGIVGYFAQPMVARGQARGVLEVLHRSHLRPDPEWLEFLATLAGQAALAVENATLFEELRRSNQDLTFSYDETIEGWARALELRDELTQGHTRRVTEMTLRIADAIGMDEAELVHVRRGSILHDMGKMGVPDAILNKPGPLEADEWEVMRRHPRYAYEMLAPIPFLRPALEIPLCHHERWDGSGYPRGLRGDEIPLAARVFAAADIYDALRSDRPYRKGWPEEQVIDHMRSLAGSHLDPEVAEVFLRVTEGGDASRPLPAASPFVNG